MREKGVDSFKGVYQAANPTTARRPATAKDERERVEEAEEAAPVVAAAAEAEAPEALAEAEATLDPVAEAEALWEGQGG